MTSGIYIRTKKHIEQLKKNGFKKGKKSKNWNGFKKGHHSKTEFKKGHKQFNTGRTLVKKGQLGKQHPAWKGNEAKYRAIHAWIVSKKGKASNHKCIDCGKQAFEWTNKDHSWKRVLEDYQPRCRSCHRKYDKKIKCLFTFLT